MIYKDALQKLLPLANNLLQENLYCCLQVYIASSTTAITWYSPRQVDTSCHMNKHQLHPLMAIYSPQENHHHAQASRPYCSQTEKRQPDLRCHCTFEVLADTPAAQIQDPSASALLH